MFMEAVCVSAISERSTLLILLLRLMALHYPLATMWVLHSEHIHCNDSRETSGDGVKERERVGRCVRVYVHKFPYRVPYTVTLFTVKWGNKTNVHACACLPACEWYILYIYYAHRCVS